MEEDLKMKITIETENDKEKVKVGNFIHDQLRGQQDYIDNNIILNIDTKNTVELYIFKECKIPTVTVNLMDDNIECHTNNTKIPLSIKDSEREEKISSLLSEINNSEK